MEVGSLMASARSTGSLAPTTAVSGSWGSGARAEEQHSLGHGDNFFSISNDTTSQLTPPAALVAPSDSPDERAAAAAASSPRPTDPFAGFGSPAALPQDDQQQENVQQGSRQQQLSHKQQQMQQQLLHHQYSHQHGSSEQLPFSHLQDFQQHGSQQQQTPSKPGHTPDTNYRQRHLHHEQALSTPLHQELQQQPFAGTPSSLSPSLQPAIERVATLGQILRQHGVSQGEAHANARLLLATISAKQVKTRQMIASVTPPTTPSSRMQQEQQQLLQHHDDKQHQQLQLQLKQATDQLAAVRAELLAARSELAAAKTAEAQQAELLQRRDHELQELRGSLLRNEGSYQAEIDGLQERLLEAEGQLAKLSAALPGGWRKSSDETGAAAAAAAGTLGSRSMSEPARSADVALAAATARLSEAAGSDQLASGADKLTVAVSSSPPKQALHLSPSLSLLTPDQAAAAQYKNWLRESQAALMAAQEDLMDRDRQIKQLERHIQQLEKQQHQEEQAQQLELSLGGLGTAQQQQPGQDELHGAGSLETQQQQPQRQAPSLQAALNEAHTMAEAAQAAAEAAHSERDSLQAELSQLTQQVQSAMAGRAEAVGALEEAQQAAELYKIQVEQLRSQVSIHGTAEGPAAARRSGQDSAAASGGNADAAAAAKVTAGEAELLEAQEAAAAALAEVAELQRQLKRMQEQQQDYGKQFAVAKPEPDIDQPPQQLQLARPSANCAAAEGTAKQQLQEQALPEGSTEYQLLRATSVNQALQSELDDTKQRLLLLLQLVKKAAASAGKQPQLPEELAQFSDAAAAGDGSSGDNGTDVVCLLQVVSGLQQRYCCSEQHQQLLLRGKEMQFLLENALQQLHLIKAAGSEVGCSCPSETEYQQLAGGQGATAAAAEPHRAATAAVVPQYTPQPSATAATADRRIVGNTHDDLLSGLEQFVTATTTGSTSLTGQVPGSCSSDALRGSAGYSGTAGNRLGFTVADEGLGYDGLDGSWWATSTVGNTTAEDLPAFLLPKAE